MKILVAVVDREVCVTTFQNEKEAILAMENELAKAMDWEDDEKEFMLRDLRENGSLDDCEITNSMAWANTPDGCNYDWVIVESKTPIILVTCYDRSIIVTNHKTMDEAREQMLSDFKACNDYEKWGIDCETRESHYYYGFFFDHAYANDDDGDTNRDWWVVNLERDEKMVDVSKMSEEELKAYRKSLNEQLNAISKRENEITEEKRIAELKKNAKTLAFLREHKNVILKILPKKHDRNSCSDENRSNAYMESGYPRCTRCMLLSILENDWVDDYKVEFSVSIREI